MVDPIELLNQYGFEEQLQVTGVICQPIRYRILQFLIDNEDSFYINEIAEGIKADRRLVSFHLSTLQRYNLVTSAFKVISKPTAKAKGKAGRYYKSTEEGTALYTLFTLMMKQMLTKPREEKGEAIR